MESSSDVSYDDARPEVHSEGLILLTGATGYVGGRLLRALQKAGRRVRCLARRPEHLASRLQPGTEVARGDALDRSSLVAAMQGVGTAYYLVHSMGSTGDFERQDREAAATFASAAREAGVGRVIYLGGLGRSADPLSDHLRSRQEVGRILAGGGAQVIEFRASIVIGSGSLSFEMIRSLTERLPVMITPRWVAVRAQPIAIGDLIAYLMAALDLPAGPGRVFEIGGADQVSYGELMKEYARQRGLRRLMIPVPVLTPRLSSLWLGLVTPVYARVGRKLVESMRHPTVVNDPAAREVFPLRPAGYREAITAALWLEDDRMARTRWSDALSTLGAQPERTGARFGTRLIDSRSVRVEADPAAAFAPIRRIGGRTGWYWGDWLWRVRGWLDLAAGGAGMRRGRPDDDTLCLGDTIDCWRVEAYEPDRRLRLAAELKLPGRAWLEFEVQPAGAGSTIRQTAVFDPIGLAGLAYWYGIMPVHRLVFAGMLRGIARAATTGQAPRGGSAGRSAGRSRN